MCSLPRKMPSRASLERWRGQGTSWPRALHMTGRAKGSGTSEMSGFYSAPVEQPVGRWGTALGSAGIRRVPAPCFRDAEETDDEDLTFDTEGLKDGKTGSSIRNRSPHFRGGRWRRGVAAAHGPTEDLASAASRPPGHCQRAARGERSGRRSTYFQRSPGQSGFFGWHYGGRCGCRIRRRAHPAARGSHTRHRGDAARELRANLLQTARRDAIDCHAPTLARQWQVAGTVTIARAASRRICSAPC